MSFTLQGKMRSLGQGGENYVSVSDLAMTLTLASESPTATAEEVATLRLIRSGLLTATVGPV